MRKLSGTCCKCRDGLGENHNQTTGSIAAVTAAAAVAADAV